MRRRELIIGGMVGAWPLIVRAQPADQMRLVGVLMGSRRDDTVSEVHLTTFRKGLADLGWVEGRR
jgi:putative ABC transport system substrate-binding protein